MPIGPVTMFGVYLICWWTVLFAVLPLGMSQEAQERPTDGAQWGAPKKPDLKRKFITTTWVSLLVWLLVMVLVFIGWMPLPELTPPAG
jgi:predicted secreted protein